MYATIDALLDVLNHSLEGVWRAVSSARDAIAMLQVGHTSAASSPQK